MKVLVLRRVVLRFGPLSIFNTAPPSDDDLGSGLFLKFLLRVTSRPENEPNERIIWILFLGDEQLERLFLFRK